MFWLLSLGKAPWVKYREHNSHPTECDNHWDFNFANWLQKIETTVEKNDMI